MPFTGINRPTKITGRGTYFEGGRIPAACVKKAKGPPHSRSFAGAFIEQQAARSDRWLALREDNGGVPGAAGETINQLAQISYAVDPG